MKKNYIKIAFFTFFLYLRLVEININKKMETITLPKNEWQQIKKILEKLDEVASEIEYVNESEACEMLGITRRTLYNYCYNGKIPADYYTTGIGGNKFFDKRKLMGL